MKYTRITGDRHILTVPSVSKSYLILIIEDLNSSLLIHD
jgi:hypothetical protein